MTDADRRDLYAAMSLLITILICVVLGWIFWRLLT